MDQPARAATCEVGSPLARYALQLGVQVFFRPAFLPDCFTCQHQGEFTSWWFFCKVLVCLAQAAAEDFLMQLGEFPTHRNLPVTQHPLQLFQRSK